MKLFLAMSSVVVLGTISAFAAQDSYSSNSGASSSLSQSLLGGSSDFTSKNRFGVDGVSFLLRGYGVSYDRAIFPKLSLGISANAYNIKTETKDANSDLIRMQTLALRSKYYFGKNWSSEGWQVGANLVSNKLDTRVRILETDSEGTASASSTGFQGLAGYQWASSQFAGGQMMIELNAKYGSGMGAQYEARSLNGNTEVTTSLKTGFGVEAGVDYIF